jgi:hypothetical protein
MSEPTRMAFGLVRQTVAQLMSVISADQKAALHKMVTESGAENKQVSISTFCSGTDDVVHTVQDCSIYLLEPLIRLCLFAGQEFISRLWANAAVPGRKSRRLQLQSWRLQDCRGQVGQGKAKACRVASCGLQGSRLQGCKLRGCRLQRCRLQAVRLQAARLQAQVVAHCKGASPTAAERKCGTFAFRHAKTQHLSRASPCNEQDLGYIPPNRVQVL